MKTGFQNIIEFKIEINDITVCSYRVIQIEYFIGGRFLFEHFKTLSDKPNKFEVINKTARVTLEFATVV